MAGMDWRVEATPQQGARGYWSPPFSIYECLTTGRCILSSGAPDFFGPIHTADIGAAKAAAERLAKGKVADDAEPEPNVRRG